MQFHPLAYMVKLNIELSMASLIVKVANSHRHGITATSLNSLDGGEERADECREREVV
jgi:hypothetical protein